jgi:hypothetical protein
LAATSLAAACDGLLSAPILGSRVEEGGLTVASVAADAPPLLALEGSVWAVRGQQREVELRYDAPGGYDGKCLRFVIPANALLRHADGRAVAPGDSVLVHVRVVDPTRFLFEFAPAGLRFDPRNPARIEVRYAWSSDRPKAGDDFGIWRQERPGEPWIRLPTIRHEGISELHAEVTGFTRFAVGFTRYALASD